MNIPWGDEKTHQFVTTVGLITSDGPWGPDIMACEWTHQISYSPALFAIHLNPKDATHENILATKEFGISMCAREHSIISSISGQNSGKKINKMQALQELGFQFVPATQVAVSLVEGAVFTAECKLVEYRAFGDHTMFVGEVLTASVDLTKEPLLYHRGRYWQRGEQISKPPAEELERIQGIIEKAKR